MIAPRRCVSIPANLHLTKGLGGPNGIKVLIATCVIGAALLLLAYVARYRMLAPKGVIAVEMPREKVLALGEAARGPLSDLSCIRGDMARVSTFAAARLKNGKWDGLAAGTIIQVADVKFTDAGVWVTGSVQAGTRNDEVTVHASFLERYLPVVLPERTMEVSDVRMIVVKSAPDPGLAVSGWLRNITSQTISQCVVTCVFQDRNEREVDTTHSEQLVLPPMQLVRFQTAKTDRQFASIALEIRHATRDGLPNYLHTIVIKRSSLQ